MSYANDMADAPTLATAQLSSQLRVAVMRVARRLRAQRVESNHSLTQLAALSTIERHGPLSPGDLATYERVQPPSMSRVLSRLEDASLIVRTPHPIDGRQYLVAVTQAGSRLLETDRGRREAWLARQLTELAPDEVEALARVLPVLEKLARA